MSVLEGADLLCAQEQAHGVSKVCVPLFCGIGPAAAGTEGGLTGGGGSAKACGLFGGWGKDAQH